MKNKIVSLLRDLVKINSVYPSEQQLGSFVASLFKSKGYKTSIQVVEGSRVNLMVEKGKGKNSILLYSHLDTISIVDGWKSDCLNLKVAGDKAYGLGAWDMKGGMAANILAFLNFNPKNIKLKMAFCVDEEYISKGGHTLIKSDFVKDVKCVISPEPSFFYSNQGIVIGRPGRAVFKVIITAHPVHYAVYEKKYDINFFISELTSELGKLYKHKSDKKQFVFIRKISSESFGISTPQKIELELDSSIIPPNTNDTIKNRILKAANNINKKYKSYFGIEVNYAKRDTPFLESYEIKRSDRFLKTLSNAVYSVTGKKAVPYFRSSVADENIFGSHGKTVLSIGPVGGNAHAPQEWVSLNSLNNLYQIISDFLSRVDTTSNQPI